MKRISFTERNRSGNLLHIEVPGAITNIHIGLTDRLGRAVTAVRILPEDETRSPDLDGYYWRLAGDGSNRVIRDVRPGLRVGEPCPEARECVFCGADIEQGAGGLWFDVEHGYPPPDETTALSCPDAERRAGGYPGLHEPASAPRPDVNPDNALYS